MTDVNNVITDHSYTKDSETDFVEVGINQIMQWTAGDADLHFYEICYPPYQDGRYENLN